MRTATFLILGLPLLLLLVIEISAGRKIKAKRMQKLAEEEQRRLRHERALDQVL